jgi:hypothetical protein
MRNFVLVFSATMLGAIFFTPAITYAQTDKTLESQTVKPQAPKSETLKKSSPEVDSSKTATPKSPKGPITDFDKFFEEGAEQARQGPACSKPPEPIA